MDRGAWWATVHGVTKSQTRLSDFTSLAILLLLLLSHFSRVQLFVTPWTIACTAPFSIGFSQQEYWSGLPFPSSWFLPKPGIEPASSASPALADGFFPTEPPEKPSLKTSLTALHPSQL